MSSLARTSAPFRCYFSPWHLIDVRFASLPARRVDKFGNPVVTFKAGLHVPEKFNYMECVRYFVYHVALGLKRVADGTEQSSDEVLAGKAPFRISFVSVCMCGCRIIRSLRTMCLSLVPRREQGALWRTCVATTGMQSKRPWNLLC